MTFKVFDSGDGRDGTIKVGDDDIVLTRDMYFVEVLFIPETTGKLYLGGYRIFVQRSATLSFDRICFGAKRAAG